MTHYTQVYDLLLVANPLAQESASGSVKYALTLQYKMIYSSSLYKARFTKREPHNVCSEIPKTLSLKRILPFISSSENILIC